nr:lysine-rich arabinogalactan protein 19-like [Aegilops tauschii subsp. strangulata]
MSTGHLAPANPVLPRHPVADLLHPARATSPPLASHRDRPAGPGSGPRGPSCRRRPTASAPAAPLAAGRRIRRARARRRRPASSPLPAPPFRHAPPSAADLQRRLRPPGRASPQFTAPNPADLSPAGLASGQILAGNALW